MDYRIERPESALSAGGKANLKYLIAIPNAIEHRFFEDINDVFQAKIQANALNLLNYSKENFGAKYDFSYDLAFVIQLQALTLQSANTLKGTPPVAKAVAAVNAFLEGPMTPAEFNDPAYSFASMSCQKSRKHQKSGPKRHLRPSRLGCRGGDQACLANEIFIEGRDQKAFG